MMCTHFEDQLRQYDMNNLNPNTHPKSQLLSAYYVSVSMVLMVKIIHLIARLKLTIITGTLFLSRHTLGNQVST